MQTSELMRRIREAGLIYDPFVTASIISYEAGHLLRNSFYANMIGDSDSERQLAAGWLANGKVELSDLITQARVLAAIYEWDWDELVRTGEDKLIERIQTYIERGVRPNETLLRSFQRSVYGGQSPVFSPPTERPWRRPRAREGD